MPIIPSDFRINCTGTCVPLEEPGDADISGNLHVGGGVTIDGDLHLSGNVDGNLHVNGIISTETIIVELTDDFANTVNIVTVGTTSTYVNKGPKATIVLFKRDSGSSPTGVFPVTLLNAGAALRFTRCAQTVHCSPGATATSSNPLDTNVTSGIAFSINNTTDEGRLVVLLQNTAAEKFIDRSSPVRNYTASIFNVFSPTAATLGMAVAQNTISAGPVSARFVINKTIRFFRDFGQVSAVLPLNFGPVSTPGDSYFINTFGLTWPALENLL